MHRLRLFLYIVSTIYDVCASQRVPETHWSVHIHSPKMGGCRNRRPIIIWPTSLVCDPTTLSTAIESQDGPESLPVSREIEAQVRFNPMLQWIMRRLYIVKLFQFISSTLFRIHVTALSNSLLWGGSQSLERVPEIDTFQVCPVPFWWRGGGCCVFWGYCTLLSGSRGTRGWSLPHSLLFS